MDYSGFAFPKGGGSKGIDYSGFALPKPKKRPSGTAVGRKNKRETARVELAEVCEWCGTQLASARHHIVKRSQLGGNCPENIISLCVECHDFAHSAGGPTPMMLLDAKLDAARVRRMYGLR